MPTVDFMKCTYAATSSTLIPRRRPVLASDGLNSFETVGSIGPISANGCITISSAPRARSEAALYALYGINMLNCFEYSLNSATNRQGTVPSPPLLHRNTSRRPTGRDG